MSIGLELSFVGCNATPVFSASRKSEAFQSWKGTISQNGSTVIKIIALRDGHIYQKLGARAPRAFPAPMS